MKKPQTGQLTQRTVEASIRAVEEGAEPSSSLFRRKHPIHGGTELKSCAMMPEPSYWTG